MARRSPSTASAFRSGSRPRSEAHSPRSSTWTIRTSSSSTTTPEDLVLQEVAAHLIARTTGETPPFSAVYASLKERYLGSHTIDEAKLDALATQTAHGPQGPNG